MISSQSMLAGGSLFLLVASQACSPSPSSERGKATAAPAPAETMSDTPRPSDAALPDEELTRAAAQVMPYIAVSGRVAKPIATDAEREELTQGAVRLENYHRRHPEDWRAVWLAGKAFQATDAGDRALAAFREAYELQKRRPEVAKGNPDLAREYMIECVKAGKGTEAVEAAEHALALAPRNPGLLANRGLALLIAGRTAEAIAAIEEAVTGAPGDRITRDLLAVAREVEAGKRPRPARYADLVTPPPEH